MVNSVNQDQLPGQLYTFNGNEPILLNDPQTVWLIQSGSLSLFAVTIKDGVVAGNRRYLFSCESDEALFGTMASSRSMDYQILAIPTGKATLHKLDRQYWRELIANQDSSLAILVDKWLKHFNTTFFNYVTPNIQVKAKGKERFSLSKGQTLQSSSDDVLWLQVQHGVVRLLGIKELIISDALPTLTR